MKNNGFTIIELLVSIIILSVVLTFAMNLFLNLRSSYFTEKGNVEMDISRTIIIDSVMSDVTDNTVTSVSCSNNMVTIQFANQEQSFNKKLYFDTSKTDYDYIRYYVETPNRGIVRKIPKGSLKGNLMCTNKNDSQIGTLHHIYYPIVDENGNDYSLDLFMTS